MKRASSSVGLIWLDCLGQVMTARQVRDLLNKVFWEVKQPERASSTLQIPRIDLSLCIHASEILVGQANQHPWSTESEPMHGQRHMRAHWKEKDEVWIPVHTQICQERMDVFLAWGIWTQSLTNLWLNVKLYRSPLGCQA